MSSIERIGRRGVSTTPRSHSFLDSVWGSGTPQGVFTSGYFKVFSNNKNNFFKDGIKRKNVKI
jgi:hypothetical protein